MAVGRIDQGLSEDMWGGIMPTVALVGGPVRCSWRFVSLE